MVYVLTGYKYKMSIKMKVFTISESNYDKHENKAFKVFVGNPLIEKLYNSPLPSP